MNATLTWKDVLNSNKVNKLEYRHIDKFFKLAVETGYEYFCWNGWIYKIIDHDTNYSRFDFTVDHVK